MQNYESEFRFYSTIHEQVVIPKLITCKEDFNEAFILVFARLGWYQQEVIPTDAYHGLGIGLSAQLEGVSLLARAESQTLSLAVTAIDYNQIVNWHLLPEILQNQFPAQHYRIISPV